MPNRPKEYEIKDLYYSFLVTDMKEDIKTEIKKLGELAFCHDKTSILYQVVLNLSSYYNKEKYRISFVKGLWSYGVEEDLWEVAVLRRKGQKKQVRNIIGFMTDNDVLEYVKNNVEKLKTDTRYYDNLPVEYGK